MQVSSAKESPQQNESCRPEQLGNSREQSTEEYKSYNLQNNTLLQEQSTEGQLTLDQERRDYHEHAADLHMAPCGCLYDPRILHVKRLNLHSESTDFAQPSSCNTVKNKNTQVLQASPFEKNSSSQNSLHMYSQHSPSNVQYILSYNDHRHLTNLPECLHANMNPTHQAQSARAPWLPQNHYMQWPKAFNSEKSRCEGNKLPQLLVTIPRLKNENQTVPSNVYISLSKRLSPSNPQDVNFNINHNPQGTEMSKIYWVEGNQLSANILAQKHIFKHQELNSNLWSQSDPSKSMNHLENKKLIPNAFSMVTSDSTDKGTDSTTQPQSSCTLPEEVSLEAAMEWFDCKSKLKVKNDKHFNVAIESTSAKKDDRKAIVIQEDASNAAQTASFLKLDYDIVLLDKAPLNCKDMLCLPHDLLSSNYTVPEISEIISTLDYFYNVSTHGVFWDDAIMEDQEVTSDYTSADDIFYTAKKLRLSDTSDQQEQSSRIYPVLDKNRRLQCSDFKMCNLPKNRVTAKSALEAVQEFCMSSMSTTMKKRLGILDQ